MASRLALIHCGDHLENQHRILALAQALESRGWYPVAMTYGAHQGAFLLRHGVDVCSLDGASTAPLSGRMLPFAFAAIRSRRGGGYRGVDTADVRQIEQARAPQQFASRRARYRWYLRLVRRVDALTAVLDRTRPGHVYVWNGMTGVVANSLRMLCERRYLRHSFLERGLVPDSVFVDPRGTNGYSELHQSTLDPSRGGELVAPEIGESVLDAAGRHAARARFGVTSRRVVFVPLQVQRDTNIVLHSDHIKTMRELVRRVACAVQGTDTAVVVRRHPEETELDLALPERDNTHYIDQGTAEQWCDLADVVVTVNSTVGLTALLRGRPVVTLGRAIYTNKGLCREVVPDELGRVLTTDSTYEPAPADRVRQFCSLLLARHTAAPGRTPTLFEPAPATPSWPWRPFNRHGVDPERVARTWVDRLAHAREAAAGRAVTHVWCQLGPRDTLDLTYRTDRDPVSRAHVRAGVAELLGVAFDAVEVSATQQHTAHCSIVVAAQSETPTTDSRTLLVVDQYMEPHVAWLVGGRL